MIKLLKKMGKREVLMAVLCTILVLGQVYFDLTLPDYMTDLTMMLNTAGSETSDILNVGLKMLGCTLASAALAIGCGYLSAKTASGFSYTVREKLFNHVMDMGSEEMQVAITARTNTHITTTNAAVTAESSQLLPSIFITAQTAMIGDFIIICKPIDIIICICVMSFVVLVIRLGMEKSCISSLPIS